MKIFKASIVSNRTMTVKLAGTKGPGMGPWMRFCKESGVTVEIRTYNDILEVLAAHESEFNVDDRIDWGGRRWAVLYGGPSGRCVVVAGKTPKDGAEETVQELMLSCQQKASVADVVTAPAVEVLVMTGADFKPTEWRPEEYGCRGLI